MSSVYRGSVLVKKDVIRRYRFCICYENAHGLPGYITEKIFDCLVAGVVPVYLGWDGIRDYVPEDTFIDKKPFLPTNLFMRGLSPPERKSTRPNSMPLAVSWRRRRQKI